MKIRISIDFQISHVVKYFVLVDLALLAGWGLIEPILSVFIVDTVRGATLTTVGIAAALYWLLKSALQVPIAKYLDRTLGERDDLYALVAGLIIAAFSAISFALVHEIWQLYVVQMFHAVGFALYAASWPAIFSRHLDKEKISFDWTLDSVAVGIAAGFAGLIGGILADHVGYASVFVLAGIFTGLSALVLLGVPELVLPPPARQTLIESRPPADITR